MSKVYPSIPDPVGTIDSLLTTVRALKQSVETLSGQRGAHAPTKVFVAEVQPTAHHSGDMWVDTSNSNKLRVWDGTAWRNVTI